MSDLHSQLQALQPGTSVAAALLEAFVAGLLDKAGLTKPLCGDAAEAIVYPQLRGSISHGIFHLPLYLGSLRSGAINPAPDFVWDGQGTPHRTLDADNALGAVAGRAGMAAALEAAQTFGVGLCAVRASNHFGVGAFYAKLAADRGMIGIALSNASATMAPWGGTQPLLGTNPLAMAFPLAGETPLIIDMASSAIARARLRKAKEAGETIPESWALGPDGNPTSDAAAAMDGTVLPFGGAKGYGIALAVELLCASLAGGPHGWETRRLSSPGQQPAGISHFFLAIDPTRSEGTAGAFAEHAAEAAAAIRGSQPAPGGGVPRLPGDRSMALERERRENGIPIDDKLHAALREALAQADPEAPS